MSAPGLHLHRRRRRGISAAGRASRPRRPDVQRRQRGSARRSWTWRGPSSRWPDGGRLEHARRGPSWPSRSKRETSVADISRIQTEIGLAADASRSKRDCSAPSRTTAPAPRHDRSDGPARASRCYMAHAFMVGGAEEMVLNLVRHLPPRFEPMVCCIHEAGPIGEEIRRTGTPVAVLGLTPGLRRPGDVNGIRRYLRETHPSIVHTFLLTASLYGRLAAILARVPDRHRHRSERLRAQATGARARGTAADGRHRSRHRVGGVGARFLRATGARGSGKGRRHLQRRRLRSRGARRSQRARCAPRSVCRRMPGSRASSRG